MTEHPIILSSQDEEHLVRILEAAPNIHRLQQLFLWVRGQFQTLLPHDIMVCISLSGANEVERIECLHSKVYQPRQLDRLCDPVDGIAVQLVGYCRDKHILPCMVDQTCLDELHPPDEFRQVIGEAHLGNAIVHGTGNLRGGNTFFALFSLHSAAKRRHAMFMELLLPSLHLAFLRLTAADGSGEAGSAAQSSAQVLTQREIEVMRWATAGKTNQEIGMILELSTLTVKNHMRRIYKKLDVHNRAQAASRCHALKLFDAAGADNC